MPAVWGGEGVLVWVEGVGKGREGWLGGGVVGEGDKTYLPVSIKSVFHFRFMAASRMVMLSR